MKKFLIIPLLIVITFSLTACSQRPYQGPEGTTLVQSDRLEYYYSNEVGSSKIFTYTFTEDLTFFEGPFAQNYDFQQIDHYELVSNNFTNFLNSFDYVYYDKVETEKDYDNLELSVGASENNYNLVDVPVDDLVYFVDAYILDPSGLRIIFSYTEFTSNGEVIIVPYHISFLVYELLIPNAINVVTGGESPTNEDLYKVDYTSYLLPIPPHMTYDRDEYSTGVLFYTKFLSMENDVLLCGDTPLEICYMDLNVYPNIYAQDTTVLELKEMYIDLFNGRIENDEFVITINNYDLILEFIEQNDAILIKYSIYTS